ncbi:putative Xaa-Pro aminopeptidase pepP [Tothia fuscella]|uniref:Xaa-Pro aminopeptidase n=1 Tax=Tothia fuscella TaxID=1048955 RepID=A0A9P4NTU5_9PEZI|nr:putative Xaa-Pro aminopeptidase pepP [Tothia fuscella]
MANDSGFPKGKYPAKAHAKKVADYIVKNGGDKNGVLYLEGQKQRMIEDNDEPVPFRQRRYFYYMTGCPMPECYATYDIPKDKLTLFIPPIDPEEVIWSGLPISPEEAMKTFDVDAVLLTTEVNPYLADGKLTSQTMLYAIHEQVSEHITFLNFGDKDFILLKQAIEIARVVKDDYEIALIRHANAVSTAAHIEVMKAARTASNERELEAIFLKTSIEQGCRNQAYHGIFASGRSAATLHYVKNDQPTAGKLNVLVDAGAESNCYASDITRTFSISGKFTPESRAIYETVLQMQNECIEMLKDGVLWDDVHAHAHRVAIAGLLKIGILKGDAEEIFKSRTSVAFFPHGLGHYLGMDTHDTGGNPNYADKDPMFRYLRVRGTLPAGSVITVEPGIYFCEFIIEPYLKDPKHSKYIVKEVLDKHWVVGGVRIEDDVLITDTSYENLTLTPKSVEAMESF